MERIETIVTTRREFQLLLKSEFIPHLQENGYEDFLKLWSRDMFVEWTFFFYENRVVTLKEIKDEK